MSSTTERKRAYNREYYLRNRERCIENHRRWSEANPDRLREWRRINQAKRRKHSKGMIRAQKSERRARVRDQLCACCTPRQRRYAYERAAKLGWHVDHIIPLSKGGPHCRHNLMPLSPEENLTKKDRCGEGEWALYEGNLIRSFRKNMRGL